jgi:hypothetical protein
MEVGGQLHAQPALPRERDAAHTVEDAGWAPGPVRTSAENLAPTCRNQQQRHKPLQTAARLIQSALLIQSARLIQSISFIFHFAP